MTPARARLLTAGCGSLPELSSVDDSYAASGSSYAVQDGTPFSRYQPAWQHRRATAGPDEPPKPVRLHDVLEEEARRIAQSLHDEAGQFLAAIHLKLDEVTKILPPEKRGPVGELKSMLIDLEDELRRLSHELRPLILDDIGLIPALDFLRQGMSRRTGIAISIQGTSPGRLSPTIETALYRIIHEYLNLAHRAHARAVIVTLVSNKSRIKCSIREQGGAGIDRSAGILAIRQRVEDLSGELSIGSSPDGCNEMRITIPLG